MLADVAGRLGHFDFRFWCPGEAAAAYYDEEDSTAAADFRFWCSGEAAGIDFRLWCSGEAAGIDFRFWCSGEAAATYHCDEDSAAAADDSERENFSKQGAKDGIGIIIAEEEEEDEEGT